MSPVLVSAFLVVILSSTPASPASGECIRYEDHLRWIDSFAVGGNCGSVDVSDSLLYATSEYPGPGLCIFDVSSPDSAHQVGCVTIPYGTVGVTVAGTHAYVARHVHGLGVVDVSDPTAPRLVGSVDTPGSAQAVCVAGALAFVADADFGLQIIDISIPSAPTVLGSADTPDVAYDVAVSGDYAYVADYEFGLIVMDVSDPTTPEIVAELATPTGAHGVAVVGAYAYIAALETGLQVINVSNPLSPQIVGTASLPSYGLDVVVDGEYAFVANSWAGLGVVDVSDPGHPVVAGQIGTEDSAFGVAVAGRYIYVAESYQGVAVFGAPAPTSGGLVAQIGTPSNPQDFVLDEPLVYVADYETGLQVVDLSDPLSPSIVGSVASLTRAAAIADSGRYVYIACDYPITFHVIDRSVPSAPVIVGSVVDTLSTVADMAVSGEYAFLIFHGDYEGSYLRVIDFSDPAAPRLAGRTRISELAWNIRLKDSRAYVTSGTEGLLVYDISDPISPQPLGQWGGLDNPRGLVLVGDYVYAADLTEGLKIVDVADPSSMHLEGKVDLPGWTTDVSVASGYAYVANGAGLQVIDVTNPSAPILLGCGPRSEGYAPSNVTAGSAYVYWSHGLIGFSIYALQCGGLIPVLVTGLAAQPLDQGVWISWDALPGAFASFFVERSESEEPWALYSRLNVDDPVAGDGPFAYLDGQTEPGRTYTYRLAAMTHDGREVLFGPVTAASAPGSPVAAIKTSKNPTAGPATITVYMPRRGDASLAIYDCTGRRIRSLLRKVLPQGNCDVPWDGRDDSGHPVPSGVYIARIATGEGMGTARVVVAR